jgi:hypothetical protein
MTKPSNRVHAELDLRSLESDLAAREALVNSVLTLAPKSPLYANPMVQQAVSNLAATFSVFKVAGSTAAATSKQAKIDAAAEVAARRDNDLALVLVKTLTENGSKTLEDVASMAFAAYTGKPPAPAMVPPESIDVTMGKRGYGRVKVAAHELGKTKRHYAAEMSPDPVGANTWSILPGSGKSRWLTGKSGTSAWVRFALVRGQIQSEWSVPVLVTFP